MMCCDPIQKEQCISPAILDLESRPGVLDYIIEPQLG
jgi:hypothetical protein